MAKSLTQMPNDFCPPNCTAFKPIINSYIMYSDDKIIDKEHVLSCENEEVCMIWNLQDGGIVDGTK